MYCSLMYRSCMCSTSSISRDNGHALPYGKYSFALLCPSRLPEVPALAEGRLCPHLLSLAYVGLQNCCKVVQMELLQCLVHMCWVIGNNLLPRLKLRRSFSASARGLCGICMSCIFPCTSCCDLLPATMDILVWVTACTRLQKCYRSRLQLLAGFMRLPFQPWTFEL